MQQVVLLQHTLGKLHVVLPQHLFPTVLQNGVVPVRQQNSFDLQEVLPQQTSTMGRHVPLQHCWFALQAGEQSVVCASTELIPNVASTPPATNPPSRFSACRRGISLARMRAALSKK